MLRIQTDFSDYYIVFIGVGLILLCFCRTIAEHLLNCFIDLEKALTTRCCSLCCGMEEKPMLYLIRCLIILYSFAQPVLFAVVHMTRRARNQGDLHVIVMSYTNDDVWTHGNASQYPRSKVQVHASVSAIDFMYIVLPFAFAMSVNTITWVQVTSQGEISFDQNWDENLPDTVASYEITYCIECLLLNVAYVYVYCSGERPVVSFLIAVYYTAVEFFFISSARCSERNWEMGVFSVGLLAVLFCGSSPILNACLQWHSEALSLLAAVHLTCLAAIITIHLISGGQATAAGIILARVLVACVASMSLLVYYYQSNGNTVLTGK